MKTQWMIVVAAVLALGCGTPDSKNNGTNNNTNNQNNNGGVLPIEFALDNVGLSSLFVSPAPLAIYDGDELLDAALYPCACGEACPAVEPAPVQELRPGGRQSWAWSGRVDIGGECSTEGMIGRQLEAEFCYGRNFAGMSEWDGTPHDIVCERLPFTVGEACAECDQMFVKLDADADVKPVEPPVRLIVENKTEASLFIQKAIQCGSNAWFTVMHNDEPLALFDLCGPCDCSEGAGCGQGCDAACAGDEVIEVTVGEEHVRELPGTYFKLYDEGDFQCTQTHLLPEAPLVAELCYGTDVVSESNDSAIVSNVVCDQVEFTLTDRDARLTVQ